MRMNRQGHHAFGVATVAALGAVLLFSTSVSATRIKDLCEIQGARGNTLKGMGMVVGLAGTGDSAGMTIQAQEELLRRMGIEIDSATDLKSDNIAVVSVTAVIPPFAKEGTRIDVHVSSINDAQSLEGGTLLETQLIGLDNQVYAMAQGPISTGGFNADGGGGAAVRQNHVTAGRIPMGAFVEREIPSTITDGERIMLLLKRPDFGTANNIQLAINREFDAGTASALGAGTISVIIPEEDRNTLVSFIAEIQNIDVEPDTRSRVVINERTGTIVIGGDVRIRPCHVAHGSLTISVSSLPVVSQPSPLSFTGETVVTSVQDLRVTIPDARLMPLEGTSAAEVAEGLNKLQVTPRDIISIFQALREAGVMDADLEIM